jgi:hypothetical protein
VWGGLQRLQEDLLGGGGEDLRGNGQFCKQILQNLEVELGIDIIEQEQ